MEGLGREGGDHAFAAREGPQRLPLNGRPSIKCDGYEGRAAPKALPEGASAQQIASSLRRLGGGGEHGAVVGLEDREPVLDVGRMVGSRSGRDAKLGAAEAGGQFRAQLLDGVGIGSEATAEVAIEAALGAGPMPVMPISA